MSPIFRGGWWQHPPLKIPFSRGGWYFPGAGASTSRPWKYPFLVDDLCRFILHEVVHIDGQFVHPEHELSTDPKYASLRQWDNQLLRAAHSTPSVS